MVWIIKSKLLVFVESLENVAGLKASVGISEARLWRDSRVLHSSASYVFLS